jgi:hypothetical protein
MRGTEGKKQFLHIIQHLLLASVLIIKGVDKISHHAVIGSIFLFFGVTILVYFFYSLFNRHHTHKLELVAHGFEAIASLFSAYIFFVEGKKFLPWFFLLAALGFVVAFFIHYRKGKSGSYT